MAHLTDEERRLCRLISETVTVNHFSDRRKELDTLISGCSRSLVDSEERLARVLSTLKKLIVSLHLRGGLNPNDYTGEDKELIERLFFFELFHRFLREFDQHISDQIKSGSKTIPLSCGPEIIGTFLKYGMSAEEGANYVSIFFQLRRAYYFIGGQLKGNCPSMIKFREQLWNNVFTTDLDLYVTHLLGRMEEYATLIIGPTGTGKGAAASAIGKSGFIPYDIKTNHFKESFETSFRGINLSQFPENLLESELFGHRKGAFTGAVDMHHGIFDTSSPYGSILLDEIGDVSEQVQIKLLKVIQERKFSPVGSHETHQFRGRVIAATNRDLNQLRADGTFRDDFYYRLCSDTIVVPSLFQRIQEDENELPIMVEFLTTHIVGKPAPDLVDRVMLSIKKTLGKEYQWPGNVRELEQCIRSIIIGGSYLGDRVISQGNPIQSLIANNSAPLSADELLSKYCFELYQTHKSYDAVGKAINLDRRTVKKYIDSLN